MRTLLVTILILLANFIQAQVFFQESFETTDSWTLSHDFDSGADEYSKRDEAASLLELGYDLFGADGDFVIAAEDTDGLIDESPTDGVITLLLDAIDITGYDELELVLSLSCNADDEAYDDRSQANGDYLDVEVSIDGGSWTTVGSFCSHAGGSSISTLFQDLDMDGDGGELGELPIVEVMRDFVIPISAIGNSAELRMVYRMNGNAEVLVIDNVRMRESPGDDVPPWVYATEIVDENTISITFQETLGGNAETTSFYSGIPGLSSATVQADGQTVLLEYAEDFVFGQSYNLVVFAIQDEAGNAMSTPYSYPFYYNPSIADLVITEVMYNDPSEADSLEFIEIYNNGATAVPLGGLRLALGVNHTLPSLQLASGEFYLVARRELAAEAFYGMDFYDYGGQLGNGGELIALVNTVGDTLDRVDYADNVPWPASADGQGPSMELVSPDLDNDIGTNWLPSTNGLGIVNDIPLFATPGALSSATLPVIQFDSDDISVHESDGVVEIEVFIAGANGSQSQIQFEIIEATAESIYDHNISTDVISLPASTDGTELLAYAIVDDALVEGVEYIRLRMTAVSNASIGQNDEITIIISDDEYVPQALFINELQSSNETTIADEAGEYDDWFEIYNPNAESIDLAGYYLSDDADNPTKDRLDVGSAETIVPGEGFLLLWADENGSQGPRHVGFKLNAAGEDLLITSPDGAQVIDQLSFGEVLTDMSYGRLCDGGFSLADIEMPSPGSTNCPNSIEELEREIRVYPNPSSGYVQLPVLSRWILTDMHGRVLIDQRTEHLDISALPSGIYTLRAIDSLTSTRIVKY